MAAFGGGKRSQGAEPLRNRVAVIQSVDNQLFVQNFPTRILHVAVVFNDALLYLYNYPYYTNNAFQDVSLYCTGIRGRTSLEAWIDILVFQCCLVLEDLINGSGIEMA